MGSRLRDNPSHMIECWCEVVAPQGKDHPPWIIQKFPRAYNEVEVLKSIPQFAFPFTFDKPTVQHFSFVLTNLESKFLYGFCRHAPGSETGLIILSHLPWHKLFYNLLNHCANLISGEKECNLWSFLQSVYTHPVPAPGTLCEISYSDNKYFVCESPNHLSLPSIPEDRNLNEYFNAVDVDNMIVIFASMLHERRIIVTSERVSKLSSCVQAANSLIYPMSWQHIFIPVLPEDLLDYLNAPMPFLIGVGLSLLQNLRIDEIGEVVILNADTNSIESPFPDVANLPEEVTASLRKNLKPPNILIGDHVARAFLKAIVHLIGNYREALQFKEDDKLITLNEEKFVSNRPPHFQPFVVNMLDLQIFRQFIDERLQLLNSGLHTSDEFELEASVYGDKIPSNMKQILSNVKKESGAIMKKVKNKTNPAMKSAVKSVAKGSRNVKEKSKITYKEIRGKFKDLHGLPKGGDAEHINHINGVLPIKPRSAPSSPSLSRKTKAGGGYSSVPYGDYIAKASYKRASQGSPVKKVSNGDVIKRNDSVFSSKKDSSPAESNKTPSPQEMDLIGELETALNTQFGTSTPSLPSQKQQNLSTSSMGSPFCTTDSTRSTSTFSFDSGGSVTPSEEQESSSDKPTTMMPLDNVSVFNPSKNGSNHDLIFLEAPQDEIFDPLLSKDLLPLPVTHDHGLQKTASTGSVPWTTSSSPSDGVPKALSPSRYLPFGSLQQKEASRSRSNPATHNPLYNQHMPFTSVRASLRAPNSVLTTASIVPSRPTTSPPPPPSSHPSNNSSAARFASTLIHRPHSSYVNFTPTRGSVAMTSHGMTSHSMMSQSNVPNAALAGQSCDQLLGDFSKEFKKLTSITNNDKTLQNGGVS